MQQGLYWENLAKRGLCRFFLLAQLAKGPIQGYRLNQAIRGICPGCCEPTEAMVYSAIKELIDSGYVECQIEMHNGRRRRVCWLSPTGEESFQAGARVWEKMLPRIQVLITQALAERAHI